MITPVAESNRVVVVGAGIVGLSIALRLHLEGNEVVVLEPDEPMRGASFGNAGHLTEASIFPPATADMLFRLPKLMLAQDGPIVVKPHYLPQMFAWTMSALGCLHQSRYDRAVSSLAALTRPAHESLVDLARAAGAADMLSRDGSLFVFDKAASLDNRCRFLPIWNSFGLQAQRLSPAELIDLEPELADDLAGGILFPNGGRCSNPRKLGERFAQRLRDGGAKFLRASLLGIRPSTEGVELDTSIGLISSAKAVLAMGFETGKFLRKEGYRVPVASERGYHLTLRGATASLNRPVIFATPFVAATPMEEGLRLAGTAEFARPDSPADRRRALTMPNQVVRYLPHLANADLTQTSDWMGVRSTLPDGVPAIGVMPGNRNVAYAFGHAHSGLTLAGITSQCVSALLSRSVTPIDLSQYSLERFKEAS
jgi:D-amino-acid dehydrogenase